MPTYALTGELASGKTTILGLLNQKGATIFNADERVHQYYNNKKSKVYAQVAKAFPRVLRAGRISRSALAATVLTQKKSLRLLEDIVHPAVIADLTRWLKPGTKRRLRNVRIAEIPLLFEKKLEGLFDKVIVIRVDRHVLLSRIQKKYKCSQAQARTRLALFIPIDRKITKADYVIDNSSTLKALRKEAFFLWETLAKGQGPAR